MKSRRPSCWGSCPGESGANITTPCFLECLFTTILGNATQKVSPMSREEIGDAFKGAFAPVADGGCPTVHVEPPHPADPGDRGMPTTPPGASWLPVPRVDVVPASPRHRH